MVVARTLKHLVKIFDVRHIPRSDVLVECTGTFKSTMHIGDIRKIPIAAKQTIKFAATFKQTAYVFAGTEICVFAKVPCVNPKRTV